jgi:putative ABC transport system permease protein
MDNLLADLRYGARSLLRSGSLSVAALLTLALGIGANTALFSVVDGILLRPLPFPEPERLVAAYADYSARGGPEREWLSYPNFADLREAGVFRELAGYGGWGPTLAGAGVAESLNAAQVSSGMFADVLGVRPVLGRGFSSEDDRPGAEPVVLLSHGLWARRFGSDPAIVGSSIVLDGATHTVIGVLPEGLRPPFLPAAELWSPLAPGFGASIDSRGSANMRAIGRLPDGVSLERARDGALQLARRLELEYPDANTGVGYSLQPLREDLVASAETALWVLLGAVGLILLIACVNVANLLLARGASRRAEIAVRAALGAGRARIARQLLTESALLAGAGGLLGFLVAIWGTQLLVAMAPEGTPRLQEVAVDGRVLGFAAATALLSGLLFGLMPALRAARGDLVSGLKQGGRSGAGPRRGLQSALVVGQVALALVLLVGSGLLLRSFATLQAVEPGFRIENRLSLSLVLPEEAYDREARSRFYDRLIARLEALPGIEGAAAVSSVPMSGNDGDVNFIVQGRPLPPPGEEQAVWMRRVTPGYLELMGIGIAAGRSFRESDDATAPPVVIINETMARQQFPGLDPVGQRLNVNRFDAPVWREIVGVARDIKNFGVRSGSRNAMYMPHDQVPSRFMSVVVATRFDPEAAIPMIRSEIAKLDPQLAASGVTTLERIVRESLAPDRFVATLLLAGVGLYGVISYDVARRTREMGIRMALGAGAAAIVRLVLRDTLALVAGGIATGGLAGAFAARLMESLLFGVSPHDPGTLAAVVLVLVVVGAGAAALPARRAARREALRGLQAD